MSDKVRSAQTEDSILFHLGFLVSLLLDADERPDNER